MPFPPWGALRRTCVAALLLEKLSMLAEAPQAFAHGMLRPSPPPPLPPSPPPRAVVPSLDGRLARQQTHPAV